MTAPITHRFRVLALTLALATPAAAAAHSGGSTELLAQLVLHPRDPDVMVLRYEAGSDGLLYSRDGGQSFRMLCASAIGDSAGMGPHIAIAGDGSVLLGSFNGVLADDGNGCDWAAESGLDNLWVRAMVQHPADPDVMFAATGTGTEGTLNALAMRTADGRWTDLGTREALLITGLVATTTDAGLRLYESVEGDPQPINIDGDEITVRECSVRMSDDRGTTWTNHPCPVSAGKLRIRAVDPTNADRIVLVEHNEVGEDIVWVSDDRGESFREWARLSDFGAIAFDGQGRVWLGDSGDSGSSIPPVGLLMAASLDDPPQVVADYPIHCLVYQSQGDTLHACQRFWLGTIDTDSGEFTTTFSLDEAIGFVACDGNDIADACEMQLCNAFCGPGSFAVAQVCEAYDGPTCGPCAIASAELRPERCDADEVTANGTDAGDAEATVGGGGDPGCDCSAPGAGAGGAGTGGPLVLVLALLGALGCVRLRSCGRHRAPPS